MLLAIKNTSPQSQWLNVIDYFFTHIKTRRGWSSIWRFRAGFASIQWLSCPRTLEPPMDLLHPACRTSRERTRRIVGVLMHRLQKQHSSHPLTTHWLITGPHGNSFAKLLPSLPQRHRVRLGSFVVLRLNKTKSSPSENESTLIFLRKSIEFGGDLDQG